MIFDWILQSRKHRMNADLIVAISPKKRRFPVSCGILLVIQCFTGGIRKYIGSMKKNCIGRGEAEPNTTFFHGPKCFTGGIRKYIGSMKKNCIGRGEAEPNTTFFHGPNIFSYPPSKTLYNEFIPLKTPPFFFTFYNLTDQISSYNFCQGP